MSRLLAIVKATAREENGELYVAARPETRTVCWYTDPVG